jgi:tetrahydromethanopterin S-methyltransferase subunit E
MLYLVAFFVPPLALLLAGMPLQAIISLVLYLASFVGLLFFITPGVVIWAIAVVHAILMIHNRRADKRAQKIIDAIEKRD